MNSGLLLLSIGLTALVGSLCTLLYTKLRTQLEISNTQTQKITQIEALLAEVVNAQLSTQHCVSELGTEIQLREVYQSADDRHQIAIKDAKEGKSHAELVRLHGLSSDEAALIVALHGNGVMNAHYEGSNRYRTEA